MFQLLLFAAAPTTNKVQDILHINAHIYPTLQSLISTQYFRYVSIHLFKDCPFWQDDGLCMRRDCAVEQQVDEQVTTKVSYRINNPFCDIEPDPGYRIDLMENPERYTGYAGQSAMMVWRAIYEENCFDIPSKFKQSPWYCKETKLFYQIVSGLHTSISMHICGEYYDDVTQTFKANASCYETRIGKYPDRIRNMLTLYALMVKSLLKLQDEMIQVITGNDWEDFHVQSLMEQFNIVIYPASSMPS